MFTKSVKHTNTDLIWQQSFTSLSVCYEKMGLPQCKNLWNFFSVSLTTNAGVWLLFKDLLALLSPLFYVIQELDRLWAKKKSTKITIHSYWTKICRSKWELHRDKFYVNRKWNGINDSFILQTAMNNNLLPPCQVYIETQTLT